MSMVKQFVRAFNEVLTAEVGMAGAVAAQIQEAMAHEVAVADPPLFLYKIPERARQAYLASFAEVAVFEYVDWIADSFRNSEKPVKPIEVKHEIIKQIRDLKILALEADERVNFLDTATIDMKASGIAQKAQARFLMIWKQLGTDNTPKNLISILNMTEEQLMEEAWKENGDYESFQRVAQGIVAAVAGVRLHYLLQDTD